MKRWSKISLVTLTCLVLAWGNGLILGTLQGFGWTKMVYEAQQELPFSEAIALTFQSEQQCEVCQYVSNTQKALDEMQLSWLQQPFLVLLLPFQASWLKKPSPFLLNRQTLVINYGEVFCEGEKPIPRSV